MNAEELKKKIKQFGVSPLAGGSDKLGIQQSPDELAEFLQFCLERDVKNVLEIGTGKGGFARFMHEALGWSITSIDVKRVDLPSDIEFINSTSVDAYPALYGREFDMVWIDGSHQYYDVWRDHLLYQHHAPIIAFHDIAPDRACCKGVHDYWRQVKKYHETHETLAGEIGTGWYEQEPRGRVQLSIVSGTYNRLSYLTQMIESARRNIPRGLSYEFVIIDGGSTDGTLKWLRQQSDVHLMEDGKLTGAISAFSRAAYRARGRYVILANDDILFMDSVIQRALTYIDERPTCGAVAFADNRLTGQPDKFRVARMGGRHPKNNAQLIYAQVGMYRKWLGDWVDWWGATTNMRKARTYGGDTRLSAAIWESGYSVDAVDGVQIFDLRVDDDLRNINSKRELVEVGNTGRVSHPDSAIYYENYMDGPKIPNAPVIKTQNDERLRILYLPLYSSEQYLRDKQIDTKHALREALSKIGMVWEVDYRNIEGFNLADYVAAWQPDLLLAQYQGGNALTPQMMQDARNARPSMVALNWCGDAGRERTYSQQARNVLEHFDLVMSKDASTAPIYEEFGIPWAYWQQCYEPPIGRLPKVQSYDVVALMNVYSGLRKKMAEMLEGLPYSVGRYGLNWPTKSMGNTTYDFGAGEALYKNAKLTVSDTFPNTEGFCSNRTVQALMANGAMLLLQKSPGLFKWAGLRSGTHFIAWDTVKDLREKIDYYLLPENEDERARIAQNGYEFAREHFTAEALVKQLAFEILPEMLGASDV